MQKHLVFGNWSLVAPQKTAGLGVYGQYLISGCRHEHDAVVDDRRGLMTLDLTGRESPYRLQLANVLGSNLRQRAVAPAVIGAAIHQPVAVFRLFSRSALTSL